MPSNNFLQALKFTLKWEGGFSNDKYDPGGKTKFGISDAGDGKVDGMADLDGDGVGDVRIEDLTKEQAIQRYETAYWKASGCDQLPLPLAVVVFDTAVNCGVGRATKWLKEAKTPKDYLVLRRAFYYMLADRDPKFKRYMDGWLNRLNDLDKYVAILDDAS